MMSMRLPVIAVITALAAGVLTAPAAMARTETITEPTRVVWHPTNPNLAYIARGLLGWDLSKTISKVDFSTTPATVTDLVTLSDTIDNRCHTNVSALAITPDGTTLYAGGYSCVMRIELSNPTNYAAGYIGQDWVQQIAVGSNAAYAIHAEGGAVFKAVKGATSWEKDWTALVAADHSAWRPVSRSGALTPDGTRLLVANETGGKDVRLINTSDGTQTTIADTGPSLAVAVDPLGTYAIVLNGEQGIKRVDLTTNPPTVTASVTVPSDRRLRDLSINFDGSFVYVLGDATNTLLKINPTDLSIASRVSLESAPTDVAASPISNNNNVLVAMPRASTPPTQGKLMRFPAAPGAPSSMSATGADESATLSFTAPQDGFSAITNYEYRLDGTGAWTPLSPADTTSPVTIPGLTNGTAVAIELRAVNAMGNGTASSSVNVTPISTPRVPRSVSATAGNAQITVQFTDPVSDGGSAITNYQYSLNGGTSWTSMSPATTTSPLTITGLSNGTTYQVSIRAVNGQGGGTASSALSVTPRDPSASSGDSGSSGSSSSSDPEPTPTPTPSPTSTAAAPAPVAVPEPVAVGEGLIVVDGRTTKVAVVAVEGRKWQVRGEDFSLEFVPQATFGQLDGSFSAKAGSWVDVNGDGFWPGTLVASYLPGALADSLGKATVGADGTFSVRARFPASLTAGQYVFQVNGLANATQVRSVNLGLRLLAADPVTRKAVSKRVIFQPGQATLTAKARANLAKFVLQYRGQASVAIAVPTVGKGATTQDRALARKRAQAVVSALKQQGVTTPVRITRGTRVGTDPSADRRVTVWFRFPAATAS